MEIGKNVAERAGKLMNNTYAAVIEQDGDWWIGRVIEFPGANAQEKTKDELLESLKLAAKDIL